MAFEKRSHLLAACALGWAILSNPLRAGAEAMAPDSAPVQEDAGLAIFGGPILGAASLDRYRGGTDVVVENTNATDGAVHNNNAFNLVTGGNSINTGSFAGASGISTVVQNSGNNVLIQAPVIVNLQVQ